MQPIALYHAKTALQVLADAVETRCEDLQCYGVENVCDTSDEEEDSDCPFLDSFYDNGGSDAIMQMKKFDAA